MRIVNICVPYLGNKTKPVNIFKGEKILTFKNSIKSSANYELILINDQKHQKNILTKGYNLHALQVHLDGFDLFWIERKNLVGRGAEIIGVISEKL